MDEHVKLTAFFDSLKSPLSPAEHARLTDMLTVEARLWEQGFIHVAGVDEAGRGPLAGPIVAAAVILHAPVCELNDSKRLSEKRRKQLYEEIIQGDHAVSLSVISAQEIDREGIQQANQRAMREAVHGLKPLPDFVLVDGYKLSGLEQPAMQLIKGDARSLSIAAASIVAKVTRDTLMLELDERYPAYGFAQHKGYGTRKHLEAIEALGPCPEHRQSFAPMARKEATTRKLF